MGKKVSIIERFWAKVNKLGPFSINNECLGRCWVWVAAKNKQGYGRCWFNNNTVSAHRVSWELHFGNPGTMLVRHKCDNPCCVNPTHLTLGTNADNSRDMVRRNRQARGNTHGSRLHPESLKFGDDHWSRLHPERLARGDNSGPRLHPETMPRGGACHSAKLTENQVLEIKKQLLQGVSGRNLALVYGVNPRTISKINVGKSWRHL